MNEIEVLKREIMYQQLHIHIIGYGSLMLLLIIKVVLVARVLM
jgi:hypothetical protein